MDELIKKLRRGFFADRPSVDEAIAYAQDVITAIGGHERIAATTALQVVMNTIANELEKRDNCDGCKHRLVGEGRVPDECVVCRRRQARLVDGYSL